MKLDPKKFLHAAMALWTGGNMLSLDQLPAATKQLLDDLNINQAGSILPMQSPDDEEYDPEDEEYDPEDEEYDPEDEEYDPEDEDYDPEDEDYDPEDEEYES